jgi:osmoprotectant transport system substrate-binding protein
LDAVSAKLTTQTLIDLLTKVTVDKQDPNAVAKEWLSSQGLI